MKLTCALAPPSPAQPRQIPLALWRQVVADVAGKPGQRVVDQLVGRTGLSHAGAAVALRALLEWPLANASALMEGTLGQPDDELVPFLEAVGRLCVALRDDAGVTWMLCADPLDETTISWLRQRLLLAPRAAVRWAVVDAAVLRSWLQRREQSTRTAAALGGAERPAAMAAQGALELASRGVDIDPAQGAQEADPVVRLLNATLYDALNARASDVHLACDAEGLAIHYRLDGVLVPVGRLEGRAAAQQAVSRLKVLAELDIAEQRLPQDGRLAVRKGQRTVDLRVSIMPGIHGEDAVLRVLDRQMVTGESGRLRLELLGLSDADAAFARRMAALPYGLFLVTGPTGSGKTTTLYAVLSESSHGLDKVITIEDPVEYELPGVLQIPVNEAKGLTFARGLRSVLRHDPDRIMVGEIRDAETAQIAVQAALTGHQVYATVHANNAVDVIGRMTSMGVDPYNLAAALNGVLAQRLLRVHCSSCQGVGCPACRGTGYRGRRAVTETVAFGDKLRALVGERAPLAQVKAAVRAGGSRSLRQAALALVEAGHTSMAEADRVTFADDEGAAP